MTRPKFANTTPNSTRRPKNEGDDQTASITSEEAFSPSPHELPPITEFMNQQMNLKSREATRPITLRFEESLWQKTEKLRGNLSKNDFFKELVLYYDKSHRQNLDK